MEHLVSKLKGGVMAIIILIGIASLISAQTVPITSIGNSTNFLGNIFVKNIFFDNNLIFTVGGINKTIIYNDNNLHFRNSNSQFNFEEETGQVVMGLYNLNESSVSSGGAVYIQEAKYKDSNDLLVSGSAQLVSVLSNTAGQEYDWWTMNVIGNGTRYPIISVTDGNFFGINALMFVLGEEASGRDSWLFGQGNNFHIVQGENNKDLYIDVTKGGSYTNVVKFNGSTAQVSFPQANTSSSSLNIGGDIDLYRSSANVLSLASGDSLNIANGKFLFNDTDSLATLSNAKINNFLSVPGAFSVNASTGITTIGNAEFQDATYGHLNVDFLDVIGGVTVQNDTNGTIFIDINNPNNGSGATSSFYLHNDLGEEFSLNLLSSSFDFMGTPFPSLSLMTSDSAGGLRIENIVADIYFNTYDSADNILTLGNQKVDIIGTTSISTLEGSYVGGQAYVCVYDNGTLFASESAC